jgi:hypothetical protein
MSKSANSYSHNGAAGVIRTARVAQTCMRNWNAHQGCGREIKPGEKYFSIFTGGLGDLKICCDCAEIKSAPAA